MYGTGFIGLALFVFGASQLLDLGLSNVTQNEDIRHRWNGHLANREAVRVYSKDCSWTSKAAFILCGKKSDSKVLKYAKLVELRDKI